MFWRPPCRYLPPNASPCKDLLAAYAWALDTGDADALVACFTEGGEVHEEVFEDADRWLGHEGLRAFAAHYFGAPGFPGRQHHATQTQFTAVSENEVAMRSFAFVTECEGEPPYVLRFAGWYDDVAVRTGDRAVAVQASHNPAVGRGSAGQVSRAGGVGAAEAASVARAARLAQEAMENSRLLKVTHGP